jgi:hypothetical protein
VVFNIPIIPTASFKEEVVCPHFKSEASHCSKLPARKEGRSVKPVLLVLTFPVPNGKKWR